MQSGDIERQVLDHIDACETVMGLLVKTNGYDAYHLDQRYIAMMQAKSTALLALSNTKAVRINRNN
ncbi:hypothetical protein D3C71_448860 [compost metagenome]